jgi:hypothetical protein
LEEINFKDLSLKVATLHYQSERGKRTAVLTFLRRTFHDYHNITGHVKHRMILGATELNCLSVSKDYSSETDLNHIRHAADCVGRRAVCPDHLNLLACYESLSLFCRVTIICPYSQHVRQTVGTPADQRGQRGSAVGIATRLRAGRTRVRIRIGRNFLISLVQTDWGAKPTSISLEISAFSLVKVAGV